MTRANSLHVRNSHYVLTKERAIPDLVWLLGKTPANIVIIDFAGDETS